MARWQVGLSAWIIQDGNYGDFQRNQEMQFALEFYPHECQRTQLETKAATLIEDSTYSVIAQVVHTTDRFWVIDFGVLAYQDASPPTTVQNGCWIEAKIYLGIDPFCYFEDIAHALGVPPLIYAWNIKGIEIETAPFIEQIDAKGGRVLVRDKSKSMFRDIEQTDAWKDDGGNAAYVLDCELLSVPPSRTRTH